MSGLHFLPGSIEPEPDEYQVIRRLWAEGATMQSIAEAVGMTARKIDHLRAAGKLELPSRGRGAGRKLTQRLPSPSEIRRATANIRSKWTAEEEAQRRAGSGGVMSDTALRITALPPGRNGIQRGLTFLRE